MFIDVMIAKAKTDRKTIVLPEGNDERVLGGAEKALAAGIADLIILGDEKDPKVAKYDLSGATFINPATSPLTAELARGLYECRKHKGMTPEQAAEKILDVTYFGVMLVKTGRADGMVCGACHSTADMLRPALQIIKTAPGCHSVSSFFIMEVPGCTEYGASLAGGEERGLFLFSDCGLEVQPDAETLAHIGLAAAKSWRTITGLEPHVAFLSHSTYGSSKKDDALKVVEATQRAKELAPELALDGELQLDAALVPEVAALKAPDSPVAGHADVLIFPDIDAGNIGYKLVQRLAKANAYGPITQGMARPANDLSRGCSAEDVFGVIAITCVQAQAC